MAVNPVDYLVTPRYIACLVLVPILALIADVVGVMGGYLLSLSTPDVNPVAYLANIPGNLDEWTVIAGILKSIAFAIVIAIVACYEGISCEMASVEVGRADRSWSIIMHLCSQFVLSLVVYHHDTATGGTTTAMSLSAYRG